MEQAPYAAACEAVQPESDLLKSLQQQLKQSPENRAGLIQQFWEKVQNQTTPIIEPLDQDHVRLIFYGKQPNIMCVWSVARVMIMNG